MEKSILKYTLQTTDTQTIKLPEGAEILTVQTQFGKPRLWALVDSRCELTDRVIEIFGTGHPVCCNTGINRKYISTYQLCDGDFVFHAFERIN